MSEVIDFHVKRNNSSSFNFRLLLVSVVIDRLAFYGLRGIIVFYAVSNLHINRDEVMYYYGFYLLVSSVASLIGGLISDFLTGPKIALIIGVSLSLVGGIIGLFENSFSFVSGMFLLLIGTGFFRTGSFSLIGHISNNRHILLEKRFILHYTAINLGAFLSSILVGLIGYYFGYFYSIVVVCLLYALSLIAISLMRNTIDKYPQFEQMKDEQVQSRSNIKFVFLAIIGIAFFWLLFEFYGYTRNYSSLPTNISLFGFQIPHSLLYVIPLLFSIFLVIPYYFLANKLSITFKLALGCFLMAALWIIWTIFFSSNLIALGLFAVLIISFIEAIIDLFITPTMMTLICRYSPKKIYGTLFGIYSILFFAGIKLGTFIAGIEISMTAKIILGLFLVGVAIFFLLLPNEFKTEKNNPVESLDEL